MDYFGFKTRFAPQPRALFRRLNFQKCSEPVSFNTFDFEMCFAPQRRALFSHISTSKTSPNMRCFGHFNFKMCFAPQLRTIFHISSPQWLRTRRFSEPTFRPSGAPIFLKNTLFRDFPTFWRAWIFFLLPFSSLIFFLLFSSPLLILLFPSVHIVRSLTSKLPSVIRYHYIII